MAFGRKCYCCGVDDPVSPELFYCKSCLVRLAKAFKDNSKGVLNFPKHIDHCVSCGQWEGRHIVYTGYTGLFPDHSGDIGIPICNKCVEAEMDACDTD